MKKKLAVLGTAIMAAVAITACGGTQNTTTTAETTTQAPTTQASATTEAQTTDKEGSSTQDKRADAEDTGMDGSEAGAELEMSEIKPFAQKVQKAVADKDMKALADLCAYPLYVSLGEGEGEEIADKDSFLKLNADQLFTDDMLKEIADTDVDTLEQFGAGVIMGNENSIIFNSVDGQAAITGINLQ